MIDVTFDDKAVQANFAKLAKTLQSGFPQRLLAVGFEIMRLSQIEVPHDKGTLQNSGTVEIVDGNVVIGYHQPQAARLHEHPEYNFQKGRKGKYLEDPIKRNERALGLQLTDAIAEELGL